MGTHENRWQDKEGDTEEKRAGCGSSQRVGSTRITGSYSTILISDYCCRKWAQGRKPGGSQEKKGRKFGPPFLPTTINCT